MSNERTAGMNVIGRVVSRAFGILAVTESKIGDDFTDLIKIVDVENDSEKANELAAGMKSDIVEFTGEVFEESDEAQTVRNEVIAELNGVIDGIVANLKLN